MPKQNTTLTSKDTDLETIVSKFTSREDITSLLKENGIGIELGVAEGRFSDKILRKSSLSYLYSVDMWAGDSDHDIEQYKMAISRLEAHRTRNSILKLRFDEALDLFPGNYFDFIYIDGYAHTGEEKGKTFKDWFPKLKSGGIFAGDDYSPSWPLVVKEVDTFVSENNLQLFVINCQPEIDRFSKYPTWFVKKK